MQFASANEIVNIIWAEALNLLGKFDFVSSISAILVEKAHTPSSYSSQMESCREELKSNYNIEPNQEPSQPADSRSNE